MVRIIQWVAHPGSLDREDAETEIERLLKDGYVITQWGTGNTEYVVIAWVLMVKKP